MKKVIGIVVIGTALGTSLAEPAPSSAARTPARSNSNPGTRAGVCLRPAADGPPPGAPVSQAVLSLAILSTPEPQRLTGSLFELIEQVEYQAHPLALVLDDDLSATVTAFGRELWPRLTAAQAWAHPRLEPHGFTIAACDAPGVRFSLWGTRAPRAPRTLRHASWAVATAAVIGSPEPTVLAARLTRRSTEAESTIGLVLRAGATIDDVGALSERARQLEAKAQRAGRRVPEWLSMLSRARADSISQPIALERDEVAVVPRLAVLARLESFVREVSAELGTTDEWRERPTSLD